MIENSVFKKNRANMLDLMADNSLMVVFAKEVNKDRGSDRNFFYLTNVEESNDILFLSKINGVKKEIIFINEYSEYKAKWFGRSLFKEEIEELSGIKDIFYLDSFERFFSNQLAKVDYLYLDLPRADFNEVLSFEETFANKIKRDFSYCSIKSATRLFATLRSKKDEKEIAEMKKAISMTFEGFKAALRTTKPGLYEYQVESYFDQAIKFNGAAGFAFETIAASGINGCVLHYSDNNTILKDGDLFLMDFGARNGLYNSDITRTFPVNGKFTERQKEIYNIVLKGQELIFKTIKPGLTTIYLNKVLIEYFAKELKRIGLIKEDSEVSKYYFHGVSHHIGLDTHDLNNYQELEAGAVISVEPGLYIKEEGIGIRIEDDALVTETGSINLSAEIFKSVDEIEDYMAKHNENLK